MESSSQKGKIVRVDFKKQDVLDMLFTGDTLRVRDIDNLKVKVVNRYKMQTVPTGELC